MKEEFNGKEYKKTNEKRIKIIIIIILVFLSIIGWNIFSGRSISNKEDIRQNIGIDYHKSWFQSFDVENNTVR